MTSLISSFQRRRMRSGSAALHFLFFASLAFAGTAPGPDPGASDQAMAPLAAGDTVVLKGPDVNLMERTVLAREGRRGTRQREKVESERPIPGRDRLLYKVGFDPKDKNRIRLVSTDDDRQGRLAPEQAVRAMEAVAYFTRQIANDPRDAGAYAMRARLWHEKKDRQSARADIDRAIEIEPKRAGLYVTRAMISIADGTLDQVLADSNKAIELDAVDSWAYVIRANVWLAKRDYPHALADLNNVIRIDRANQLDWSVRFRYWLHVKDHDYANRDKNEGVPLDPGSAITHLWRGDVWCADQDLNRAIAEYTEAIRLETASALAHSRTRHRLGEEARS